MAKSVLDVPGFWRQMALTTLLSMSVATLGSVITWPTVLPNVNNKTANFNIDLVDVQWLVSSPGVTALVVPVITGPLMEVIGSARLLTICAVPTAALWIIMAFVPFKAALYVGRLGHGLTMGMITTFISPFSAELVSPEIRGIVGSFMKVSQSLGMLYTTLLVACLHWQWVTVLLAAPMALSIPFYFIIPESPFWLVKRGRDEEALNVLAKLRGPRGSVGEELDRIKKASKEQPSVTVKDQFQLLREKSNYRPFFLVLSILLTASHCGQGMIYEYTVIIFEEVDTDLDPFFCNILVSVSRLLSSILSVFIIDLVDRRPLLIGSALACALSMALSSVALIVPQAPGWLATAFILVYVLTLNIGLNPISTISMSEILPTPVRSVGLSIIMSIVNMGYFITAATFPIMLVNIGLANSFFIYASFSLLAAFIYWKFAPETRGRSLADLQNVFVKPKGETIVRERHTCEENTESIVRHTKFTPKETATNHDNCVSPYSTFQQHDSMNIDGGRHLNTQIHTLTQIRERGYYVAGLYNPALEIREISIPDDCAHCYAQEGKHDEMGLSSNGANKVMKF